MAIAYIQFDGVGPRMYAPEGPFGTNPGDTPIPSFRPGEVVSGDAESEFVYLYFNNITAGTVLNQGDVLAWDNTYIATPAVTSALTRGQSVGTFFCGGNFAGGAISAPFSFTFATVGLYGMWVQRAGTSLINAASTAANANLVNSTTTAKTIDAPASPLTGSKAIVGMYISPASATFTANTVNGSPTLSAVSTGQFLEVGGTISGTGIPTGTVIKAINGSSITMSNAATATGTGVTITRTAYSSYGTTTSGSPVLTALTTINGFYPGQTIAGTGIPGSTTILSIQGNPGNYSLTMSANATASASSINFTTTLIVEGYLKWPYCDKTN